MLARSLPSAAPGNGWRALRGFMITPSMRSIFFGFLLDRDFFLSAKEAKEYDAAFHLPEDHG